MENNSTNEINTIQIPSVNPTYPTAVKISFWLYFLWFVVSFFFYSLLAINGKELGLLEGLYYGAALMLLMVLSSFVFGVFGLYAGIKHNKVMSFMQRRVSIYSSILMVTVFVPVSFMVWIINILHY